MIARGVTINKSNIKPGRNTGNAPLGCPRNRPPSAFQGKGFRGKIKDPPLFNSPGYAFILATSTVVPISLMVLLNLKVSTNALIPEAAIAVRAPIIAITINISTRVKPLENGAFRILPLNPFLLESKLNAKGQVFYNILKFNKFLKNLNLWLPKMSPQSYANSS